MNDKQYCMQCGTQTPISALFCPKCGNKFVKSVLAEAKVITSRQKQNLPDNEDEDDEDIDSNDINKDNALEGLNMNELCAVELVGESIKDRRQKMENVAFSKKTGFKRPKHKVSSKKLFKEFQEESKSSRSKPFTIGGEE
jgi:hypothetical protein